MGRRCVGMTYTSLYLWQAHIDPTSSTTLPPLSHRDRILIETLQWILLAIPVSVTARQRPT